MGIVVMVGVEEAGKRRVLDFILPSWLHERSLRLVRSFVDAPAILTPLERLDVSAYDDVPPDHYTPCTRDEALAAVAEVVRTFHSHPHDLFPADDHENAVLALGWYEKLHTELLATAVTAKVFVDLC